MILLDYDYKKGAVRELGTRIRAVEHILKCKLKVKEAWETKKGYHFYVETSLSEYSFKVLIDDDRSYHFCKEIATSYFQALLGSDWRRELYNIRNAMRNPDGHNNVLFRSTEVRRDRLAEVLLNSGLGWMG